MKLLSVLAVSLFIAGSAMASDLTNEVDWLDVEDQQLLELDAPYLIQVGDDWFLGTSLSKDVKDTNWEEGWTLVAKATYRGTLLKLFGK